VCVSLTILNGGLGILLGASQPNRRRAIILGVVAFFVLTFFMGTSGLSLANPTRFALITYFAPLETEGMDTLPSISISREAILTIIWGIGELIALFALVWTWLHRQEKTV